MCVQGLEVIITDIDALVLREPFAYMNRWPDAGFLTTSDHLGNTTGDGLLEDHREVPPVAQNDWGHIISCLLANRS